MAPKTTWTAQDEEERERRRAQVEAQRAQQIAENQARAQADAATKKAHQESVTKTGNANYSAATYAKVQAENRGYQDEVQRQTAGRYAPSQYKHAYETIPLSDMPKKAKPAYGMGMVKFDGDYSRFRDERDVYETARGIKDADQQNRFLKGWADYTGSDAYKNKQKRDAAMTSLSGLYDANGKPININTASYSQVVQGIRSIADSDKRNAAIENLTELTKTEGSRFYGQTIDKALLKTYLGNPDFTEDDYNRYIKRFSDAFYPQSGYEEQNSKTYTELLEGIESSGYSEDIQRQLVDRLNVEYKNSTGKDVPTRNTSTDQDEKTEKEDTPWWEAAGGWISDLWEKFSGGDKGEDETLPGGAVEVGKVAGAAVVDMPYVVKPSQKKESLAEVQGPAQRKAPSLAQALEEGIPVPKEQVIDEDLSAPDAYIAWRKGYKLSDENMAKLKPYLSNPDIRAGLLMATEKAGSEYELARETDDLGEYIPHEQRVSNAAAETARYSKMGKSIASAASGLDNGAVPDDMAAIGRIMLADVALAVQTRVEAGDFVVPEGKNMYEYVLSLDEGLRQQVDQVKNLPKVVNDIKTENAVNAAKAEKQAMEDAYTASATGDATDAQMAMLAQREDIANIDPRDDDLNIQYRWQLSYRSPWYSDDGAFWSGDSAAAQEGQRLREAGRGYSEYKYDLMREAETVIDDYTRVALSHNMSLEKYLGLTGMELEDLMDVTYNRMSAVGASVLEDPEMPAVIDSATSTPVKSIGLVAAGVVGAGAGLVSYAEGFMNAPYQIIDVATYEARRDKLIGDYEEQYGEQAPYVYRKQLTDYAKSGKLDNASSEALLANIQRANDIFDVAFEIDPGFFAGAYRDSIEALGKTMDTVANLRAYLPKAERMVFDGVSMITNNAAGMLVSTATGSAVRGMGFGTRTASAVGSAMAYGGGSFMDAYTEGTRMGLTDTMSAWRGLSRALGTIAMNMGGTNSMIDLYGGSAARRGFEKVARQNKSVALAVLKEITKHGVEEGVEEIAEVGLDKTLDLFDSAVVELDQGKPLSASMLYRSAANTFTGMDVKETLKEIAQAGMGGFFAGALFSAGGMALDGIEARRGVKMENQYDSIKLAGQIVRGEIEPTEEKLAEFAQALAVDVQDATYSMAIDRADAQAREATNMVTAALTGAGVDARNAMITENQKADSYEEKAVAAEQAVAENQSQYLKLRQAALQGNLEAAKQLEGYRTAWAKAGTMLKENHEAAEKARQMAGKYLSEWLGQCRAVASVIDEEQLRDATAQMVNARNATATQTAVTAGIQIKEGADPAQVVEDLKFMGEYPPNQQAEDYIPPYTDEDAPPEQEGYADPAIEAEPITPVAESTIPTGESVAEVVEIPAMDEETRALQEEREAIQAEPALDLKGNMRTLGVANKSGQFAEAVGSWDGQQAGLEFVVAKTGDALKSIGMADADVVLKSDKLKLIKEKHPEMSDAVIAQLPEVIENPVVVMESATIKDRVVLMGTVTDDAGSPVAVVVSINPNTNLVAGTQFLRMNSAYGKDRSPQDWVNKHKILYADKNRAAEWAMSTGLQLPVDSTPNSDSSTIIVAQGENDVKRASENIQADYVGMDNVRAQPTPTTGRARHNPIQTFNRLAKDLGIGKTFGTRKMNGLEGRAAGYYETNAQYVVSDTRHASSIEVDAHELGHAIAARLNMTGTQQMVNNLTARFPANYPAAQLPGEAFAEFFWRYLVSDQDAENFAGRAYMNTMERNLRREGLLDSVKTAQREVRQFLNASAEERFRLMTRDKSDTANEDTIGERLMSAVRQFITSVVDSTRAAEDVNDAVREQNDGQVDEAHNLRNAALMQGHATKRAATVLNDHLTDVHGTVVGASLKRRLADAGLRGRDFDTFISYMLAKHSIDRDRQSKLVVDRGAISIADTEAFIRDTERNHPEIAAAARAFQEFRHDFMMEYMVRTGFMTEQTLNMFEAMYPNYVPTYRVKDRGRRGIGGQTYTIRQATGSTEQIINPMDSFVDMVNTIVAMNLRNETYKTFDRVYNDYDGMGIFGREVTQDRRPDMNFAATQDEVLDILMQANADDDVIRQVLNVIGRPHNTNDVNLPNIIRVQMEDGSTKFYEIFDQPLFDMFEGTPDSGGASLKILRNLTGFMSAMTTGSNPVFGIRNALRDYQNSVNYGSWAGSYATGLGRWLNAAWDVFRDGWIGEHTGLNANNATYEQYKALGGGGWTRVDTRTRKGMAAYRGDLIEGYNTSNVGRTVKWLGKKIWNGVTLSRLNEIIEQTSRYAEYKHGQHDLSTVEGRREAFLAAQDVTTDFSRRGNSAAARELKAFIPFFNASLQGIYRTGRQFTEGESDRARVRFMKTIINTGLTSALASLMMLKYMDDEDKEEFFYLSDDLKAKHMYLPNFAPDILGEAPLIRIPLNQDPLAYAIHAAVTNAVWSGEGEEWAIELGAIADNIMSSLNPISSTVIDPILAIGSNKNWYGSNIVPRSMDGMYATNQYSAETAQMFIDASHVIDAVTGKAISPMMLQYIAEQYTGFVGQMVIPFFSKNEFTGEINGIDAVIEDVRKTLVSDPLKSNDIVSTVYDSDTLLNQVTKAGKNEKPLDMLRRGLSQRDAQRAYDEAYEMTHKGGVIYESKKEITACYEEIDSIEMRTDLTDAQKYMLQSEVRREMIEIALDANEAMAEFREKYIDGESFLTRFMKGTVIRKESDDD